MSASGVSGGSGSASTPSEAIRTQVERNYQAFLQQLSSLLATHKGKFSLMRDGNVVEFFDTARDAYIAGQRLFQDRLFSVQEVTDTPVDLGFYSHAVPER